MPLRRVTNAHRWYEMKQRVTDESADSQSDEEGEDIFMSVSSDERHDDDPDERDGTDDDDGQRAVTVLWTEKTSSWSLMTILPTVLSKYCAIIIVP